MQRYYTFSMLTYYSAKPSFVQKIVLCFVQENTFNECRLSNNTDAVAVTHSQPLVFEWVSKPKFDQVYSTTVSHQDDIDVGLV